MGNIRILFLAADPRPGNRLALDEEARAIDRKIREAGSQKLKLITEWAVRPDDVMLYLNRHRPHVVHFSGHGSDAEQLIFVGDGGAAKPLPKEAIDRLFRTFRDNIRLVVFNACFSRPQAEAVVKHIDSAIGMRGILDNEPAIAFAAGFYRALGFGRSVKEAFEQGVLAPIMQGFHEDGMPTLLAADGVDLERVYFARRYRIVVVDDEPAVGERLKEALEVSGHTVYAIPMVTGPEELRREIKGLDPDAVVLDYEFRGLKLGQPFVTSLRKSAPQRPILYYTRSARDKRIVKKLQAAGIRAADIIPKEKAAPDSERLLKRIGEIYDDLSREKP